MHPEVIKAHEQFMQQREARRERWNKMYNDEDGPIRHLFDECRETAYDNPDSHWYLEGWCQDKSHFYASTKNDFEHNDWSNPEENYRKHEFIAPTEPLVWGENASRLNICPGTRYAEDEEYGGSKEIEECTCPCHWRAYYVNVYEVYRAYGGPEEGGWYYDVGTPYEALKCETWNEASNLRDRMWEKYNKQNTPGADFKYYVHLEDHFAESYPEHRPHYE